MKQNKAGAIKKLADKILNIFWPATCMFCNQPIESGHSCFKCSFSLPYRNTYGFSGGTAFLDECCAPFHYEDGIRNAVKLYKFRKRSWYAREFAPYMDQCIEQNLTGKYDIISFVPVGPKRLKQRGFDQAYLLSREISKMSGTKPVRTLRRVVETRPQSSLCGAASRKANIFDAFAVSGYDVEGLDIILVDDVFTTGATISECARVLKTAGARRVYGLTLAKTRMFRKKK